MKIWIFEYAKVSDHYHDSGGMVFLARDKAQVLSMLPTGAELDEDDWERVRIIEHPSLEMPEVFVFPDAGCC